MIKKSEIGKSVVRHLDRLDAAQAHQPWKECKLVDMCKNVLTGGTPNTSVKEYFIGGTVPWLKTKEVNYCRIRETENFITFAGVANSSAKIVPENSVIVAMYGQGDTAGRVAINKIPLSTNQACCNLVIDPDKADYNFIYYCLSNSYDELVNRKTGSAQPNLNTQLLKSFVVIIPPLPEQRAIAGVLSSLDDKIDLLHRQNKTLEAMAETLFRQWFVEEANDGWEEGKLENILQLSNGKTRPNTIGQIPVYGGNGILDYTDQYNYEGESIIIGRVGAYCGSLYFENSKIWVSDNALHAKSKSIDENYFLYYLLKTLCLNSFAEGSSHPLLTQTLLNSIDIVIPPFDLRSKYNDFAKSINLKITSNIANIRTLVKLRDLLLPKLMSGEVRVES